MEKSEEELYKELDEQYEALSKKMKGLDESSMPKAEYQRKMMMLTRQIGKVERKDPREAWRFAKRFPSSLDLPCPSDGVEI